MSFALPRPHLTPSPSGPFAGAGAGAGRRRWRDGPTPVSLADLTALTRALAEEVRSGRHTATVDATSRWSQRLHADAYLDVWLIGWAPTQAAELHDHGGSLGALTVVRGELTEWRWSRRRVERTDDTTDGGSASPVLAAPGPPGNVGPGLRHRLLRTDRGAAFALGHVHDVSNRGLDSAVSVHAYSPPLSTMSYYEVDGDTLRRTRSELVPAGVPPE
ncbi:cysteine dioxygenase family protein [Actinomycetospora endophytica]|uniref:Cysteine dioxygenase family protein n=1 Tax=Actinomycetospora endophytica TaxID=2291215 RepID=A0ABS8P1F9_9PSEU|nr:cysteine dioxygenase family protein [Actinomycetospora endophytica]MCD2191929.1 cysteine dioxygenase family protein [Actinomycetospora endophytica]